MSNIWLPVNLDKREFIDPCRFGSSMTLSGQIDTQAGTGTALLILQAAMPVRRGGGDLEANEMVGRWAGDRIVLVSGYAKDSDLPSSPIPFSLISQLCVGGEHFDLQAFYKRMHEHHPELITKQPSGEYTSDTLVPFTDISSEVCEVIEAELGGKFVGEEDRRFKWDGE